MEVPKEVPVMTLPNVTLFPQALLPLYIFEPKYRKMLRDALETHRMFTLAMLRPGATREAPEPVAGLGLIRVSVGHSDGTSHLILQGLVRVQLEETVRYKPYRIQRIRPIQAPPSDSIVVDALVAKVRELVGEYVQSGYQFPLLPKGISKKIGSSAMVSSEEVLEYLNKINDPDQVADLVSCAILSGPAERQTILKTVDLETRLKHLIHFLLEENRERRKGS
jgi:ATP-dependent Lon protease